MGLYKHTHTYINKGNPLFKGWGEKEKAGGVLTVKAYYYYYYYYYYYWENKLQCSVVQSSSTGWLETR
jgi:hypothetical protein